MREASIRISTGTAQGGQSVSVTTSAAATSNAIGSGECLVYSTVECFAVAGATATVAAGTPIPASTLIRLTGIPDGATISFIAAEGSGTAYVRPGA